MFSLFIGGKINAFESSLTVNQHGSVLYFNGSSITLLSEIPTNRSYPAMKMKNSTGGHILCVSGFELYVPNTNDVCTYSEWSGNEKYGVAYIINLINNTNGSANEKYYWEEVLINQYLGNIKCSDDTTGSQTCSVLLNDDSSVKILNTNKNISQIVSDAKNYANSNPAKAVSITVAGKETINLTFTENSDGYYYSDAVTISANSSYSLGNISNSKFTYTKNGDTYTFKIKASDIGVNSTESFTISAEAKNTYYVASKYDCPGQNVQDVTLDFVESKTNTDTVTITGSVTGNPVSFEVKKMDNDKKPIEGATFMIQTQTQKNNGINGVGKKTNSEGKIVFDGLSAGTYYVTETVAPTGFLKDTTPIKVTIDKSGNITVNGVADADGVVEIYNTPTSVLINKIDEDTKESITGVKLQLLDINKKEISCTQLNSDGTKNILQNCTWVSTKNSIKLVGLPTGTYYLKEVEAKEGYILNSTMIKILIDDAGNIYVNDKVDKDGIVEMTNKITETVISKISAVDSKELPGATLRVLNEKKENMSCTIIDADGKRKKLDECTWVSTDNPVSVVGLGIGKYYLEETNSPKGYVKNTEMVLFEVKADGKNTEVVMKNELEVEVPNTLSSRSALLLAIAMFDIALGIGIVTYVKKNKIKE